MFLLTLFTLLMTMDFSSKHTDGSVRVVMCLFYPPTCSMLEDHLNITPSFDLNVQLVTHLMVMMEKNCPECILRHYCCDFSDDLLH